MVRTHKRDKHSRIRGKRTIGWGARKKHKKSGHKGGKGMSGSGKRADHKKMLVTSLYGNAYFGKQGITSKRTQKDKRLDINLRTIQDNLDNYIRKGIAKKTSKGLELDLTGYKILGEGEVKEKLIIKAWNASQSAIDKVKKAGGEIQTLVSKEEEKESEESPLRKPSSKKPEE